MHEEMHDEHRAARPGMAASPKANGGEIHVPVMGEEVVVEKRTMPTEEVVSPTCVVRNSKTVEADLKREEVDVERTGEAGRRSDGGTLAPLGNMNHRLRSESLWRGVLPLAAALVLGFGTLSGVHYLAHPLALLVIAITVAEALSPLVSRLERFAGRGVAVSIVYLSVAAVSTGLAWFIAPTVVTQGEQLVQAAPALTERVRGWIEQQNGAMGLQISTLFGSLPSRLGSFLVWLPLRMFRSTIQALVVVFLSIYWLLGSPGLQRFTLTLFPPAHRDDAGRVLVRMGQAMGGYVRGAAINAVIMDVLAWLGLRLLHVPYALTLGALTMFLEPIPFLGPILAAVPVVLVAFSVSPTLALYALGLYTVLQGGAAPKGNGRRALRLECHRCRLDERRRMRCATPCAARLAHRRTDWLANDEAMAIRRPQHELAQSIRTIAWRRENLRSARACLVEELIHPLDHQVHEPRVIAGRIGRHLIRALPQHQVERVAREKAPSGRPNGIFREAEHVDVETRGALEVLHGEHRPCTNHFRHDALSSASSNRSGYDPERGDSAGRWLDMRPS